MLPGVACSPTMLLPKGAVGAIVVLVVQLSLVTWDGRLMKQHERSYVLWPEKYQNVSVSLVVFPKLCCHMLEGSESSKFYWRLDAG